MNKLSSKVFLKTLFSGKGKGKAEKEKRGERNRTIAFTSTPFFHRYNSKTRLQLVSILERFFTRSTAPETVKRGKLLFPLF